MKKKVQKELDTLKTQERLANPVNKLANIGDKRDIFFCFDRSKMPIRRMWTWRKPSRNDITFKWIFIVRNQSIENLSVFYISAFTWDEADRETGQLHWSWEFFQKVKRLGILLSSQFLISFTRASSLSQHYLHASSRRRSTM